MLGGVEIPYARGLDGHSDADVLLHALIDALLGAAALGDIGTLFPSSDAQWAGASGLDLLGRAYEVVQAHGYAVVNIDCTVVAQDPKLIGSKTIETIAKHLKGEKVEAIVPIPVKIVDK